MAKQTTIEVLHDSGISSEFLPNEKQSVIRSIFLVRNGSTRYLLRNSQEPGGNEEFGQVMAVTDLLDHAWYLVEAIESGYRLFFHLDEGEVVVELAPEADLPTIAQDLTRRIGGLNSAQEEICRYR